MVCIIPLYHLSTLTPPIDAQMKVSLDVLQRVYEAFQNSGENPAEQEQEAVDPDSHLHFVNAFDMPLWNWSHERSTFERQAYLLSHPRRMLSVHQRIRSPYNIRIRRLLRYGSAE